MVKDLTKQNKPLVKNSIKPNKEYYIPTIEACTDFGIKRGPSSYNSGSFFMKGEQFQEYIKKLDKTGTPNDIKLKLRKNYPNKITETTSNGVTTTTTTLNAPDGTPINPDEYIATISILPNFGKDKNLDLSHSHTWDTDQGIIASIISSAVALKEGIESLLREVGNIAGSEYNIRSLQTKPMQYLKSDFQSITIPFTLFTKGDYKRDIAGPLLILTAISYPNRVGGEKLLTEKLLTASQLDSGDLLNRILPGLRLYAIENPFFIDIEHSSKLFNYKNCYIEKIDFNFKGTWVDENGTSYPSAAECSITLKTSEAIFADDYIAILNQIGYTDGAVDGIINALTEGDPTKSGNFDLEKSIQQRQQQQNDMNSRVPSQNSIV
jgi:hypothetical protein